MSAIALMTVAAASLSGHLAALRWVRHPPQTGEILTQFQHQPQLGATILDQLPLSAAECQLADATAISAR